MLESDSDDFEPELIADRLEAIAVRLQQLADERADVILIGPEVGGRPHPDAADEYADLLAWQAVLTQRLAEQSAEY